MKRVTAICLITKNTFHFKSRRTAEKELNIVPSLNPKRARIGYVINPMTKDGKKDDEIIKSVSMPLNELVGTNSPYYIYEKNHFLYINKNHIYKNYSHEEIANHLEKKQ